MRSYVLVDLPQEHASLGPIIAEMTDLWTMALDEFDDLWFRTHPGRQFRLRPATLVEAADLPETGALVAEAWAVIRREDRVRVIVAVVRGCSWDDADSALAPFFAETEGRVLSD